MKPVTDWEKRYQEGNTGWDLGGISTPLKDYFDQLKNKEFKILIPGAGNAYEAAYLHENGFKNVFVLDLAPSPLKKFQEKYPDFPNENLIQANFFDHQDKYDLIIEQTFFCAIDPKHRQEYAKKSHSLLKENGKLPKIGAAMTADASASVVGACVGTSPVTSYVESATGVSAGGRTGLTAVVVSVCFLLSLFLTPLMKVIPLMATTPALLMVGILMMESIRQVDFDDSGDLATASVALIAMPLTFSISEGIALGFITYVGIKVGTGKYKEVSLLTYAMAIVFLLRYLLDLK